MEIVVAKAAVNGTLAVTTSHAHIYQRTDANFKTFTGRAVGLGTPPQAARFLRYKT